MRQCAETPVHIAIVEYLRAVLPGALIWHTPNGGKRSKREAAELKRMGVLAGVFDIAILTPLDGSFYPADGALYFLEVKGKRGVLSDPQMEFGAALDARGIPWMVVRSIDDTRLALSLFGIRTREAEIDRLLDMSVE